jgi:hypothetical protein
MDMWKRMLDVGVRGWVRVREEDFKGSELIYVTVQVRQGAH